MDHEVSKHDFNKLIELLEAGKPFYKACSALNVCRVTIWKHINEDQTEKLNETIYLHKGKEKLSGRHISGLLRNKY